MKKILILISLFLIILSQKCNKWERYNVKLDQCKCIYPSKLKGVKCGPPRRFCPNGIYKDGRCKPRKIKENILAGINFKFIEASRRCPPGKKYSRGMCVPK